MKNAKKDFWQLNVAQSLIKNQIDQPSTYENAEELSRVAELLASFCKVNKLKKEQKEFLQIKKLFDIVNKQNKKKLGYIEHYFEIKTKPFIERDCGLKRYKDTIDLEKYKGEKLNITYTKNGTVKVDALGVIIEYPKSKVKYWEEKTK